MTFDCPSFYDGSSKVILIKNFTYDGEIIDDATVTLEDLYEFGTDESIDLDYPVNFENLNNGSYKLVISEDVPFALDTIYEAKIRIEFSDLVRTIYLRKKNIKDARSCC
jgi:hypothetical protein